MLCTSQPHTNLGISLYIIIIHGIIAAYFNFQETLIQKHLVIEMSMPHYSQCLDLYNVKKADLSEKEWFKNERS